MYESFGFAAAYVTVFFNPYLSKLTMSGFHILEGFRLRESTSS